MTPEGRAKALQSGATPAEIAGSVLSCTLCGACEPVCPEEIDLVGMTLGLRTRLAETAAIESLPAPGNKAAGGAAPIVFIPGPALRSKGESASRVAAMLGGVVCADEGQDIAQALEAGFPVSQRRRDLFLAGLRPAQTVIVDDGLWLRHLRGWLPRTRIIGLGEALSSLEAVRNGLRKSDLYVIEPRSYHANYERLVKHYDRLRTERGCAFNLDLHRIAIPADGQAEWILKGLTIERVVVERLEDAAAFAHLTRYPAVHVAELADH